MRKNVHKEITSLSQLTSDPKNARRHTPRNVGTIVDALHEVGAARSIVIDEKGVVLAGNATMDAAIEAGLTKVQVVDGDGETVIAVRRKGLTKEQKTRLALYDNRAAELAEWNPDILAELAPEELKGMFSDKELAEILSQTGVEPPTTDADVDIDKAAELQQKWQVATGEVIQIGRHVLMCGDCESLNDITQLLGGKRVELLHADPPYGIDLQKGKSGHLGKSKCYRPVENDDKPFDPRPLLKISDKAILWGANHYADKLPASPFWLVWDKQGGAKDTTFATCELAWSNDAQPARVLTHVWDGFRRDSEKGQERFHPNQKPVAVIQWALSWIKASTVADFYAGVGAGMVACENLDRQCFAMEGDEAYCAVILERMTKAFPNLKIERVDQARAA